jgi:hypothetical protein
MQTPEELVYKTGVQFPLLFVSILGPIALLLKPVLLRLLLNMCPLSGQFKYKSVKMNNHGWKWGERGKTQPTKFQSKVYLVYCTY